MCTGSSAVWLNTRYVVAIRTRVKTITAATADLNIGEKPRTIGVGQLFRAYNDEFGPFVGRLREQRRVHPAEALMDGLDQQQVLAGVLDPALPAIDGLDLRNDVDARGEPFLHQQRRKRKRIERRADGRQYDDRRH